jgi:dihydroorotate dehydrogenase (fumarate)
MGSNLEGVVKCADAGVGAIVLKSLFEEQLQAETEDLEKYSWMTGHTEAFDYISRMGMALGPREYLNLVKAAKSKVSVPIIASLNCVSPKWWTDYAKQIAAAGADGLELNISVMPSDTGRTSEEVEGLYLEILEGVKAETGIPIAVKIGSHFSSIARMADQLCKRGASALVLFNRFYQLDIDIENLKLTPGYKFSSPGEMNVPLRWIALLSGRVKCDLAASTGVHDGAGVIKQLLAGATVVQLCSTLYVNGLEQVGRMLGQLQEWSKQHGFETIEQMRGKMSQLESDRPELYERLQYIKALVGIE